MLANEELIKLKNPKNVSIKIGEDDNFHDVLIVQQFQYRIDETKKPNYGFSRRHYHNVLAGKAIASGTIVIKKHSKDALLGLMKATEQKTLVATIASSIKSKLDLIYELMAGDFNTYSSKADSTSYDTDTKDTNVLKKFGKSILAAEVANRMTNYAGHDSSIKEDELLRMGHSTNIKISVDFSDKNSFLSNKVFKKNPVSNFLIFDNVQFVSKEASIVVGDNDIDEVYSFIANVEE